MSGWARAHEETLLGVVRLIPVGRAGRSPQDGAMTLRSAGAGHLIARNEEELIAAVREADEVGLPVLLAADAAEAGRLLATASDARVIQVPTGILGINDDGCEDQSLAFCGGESPTVAAGEPFNTFLATAVTKEWHGVEALAGTPGTVGAAVEANASAYGQSVADLVAAVRTYDREKGMHKRFAAVDCAFTDNGSRFSRERRADGGPRYLLLDVTFLFTRGDLTAPIEDADLAALLGQHIGARVPISRVREAVLAQRTSSGEGAQR